MPAYALAAQFQAGESGIGLTWQANTATTATPISLSGSNVTMVFEPANNPSSQQTRTCLVQSDGNSCIYITTTSDFPVAGLITQYFYVQFIATYGDGTVRKSPVSQLAVGPSLQ